MAERNSSTGESKRPNRRSLASSQIAKKRELDRAAQRASRERARNRMAFLEEKLQRLEADDKQAQISELMSVIGDLRNENSQLRAALLKIRSWADISTQPNTDDQKTSASPTSQSPSPSAGLLDLINGSTPQAPVDQALDHAVGDLTAQACQESTNRSFDSDINERGSRPLFDIDDLEMSVMGANMPASAWNEPTDLPYQCNIPSPLHGLVDFDPASFFWPSYPSTSNGCYSPSSVVPDEEKWSFGNEAYTFGVESSKKTSTNLNTIDPHAPFKAILWGWDVVDEEQRSHPMWTALRKVDEQIFGNWQSKAQKIALMFVTHRLLIYRSNPTQENLERVPSFLRPRPSQERIQHPLVIDFLIWPGLRDRLVFSHEKYTRTGEFSAMYCNCLRFHWPFPDTDILTYPIPNATQYLIDVQACAANFFDLLQVRGKYQTQPPFPWIAGFEFAGIVLSTPSIGKTRFQIGDRVFGASQGAYATKICADENKLQPVPPSWTIEEAAGLYLTGPTSYASLVLSAKLQEGEWCLIHGAAGGVGLAAVQIAKALGAKVIATTTISANIEACKSFGADFVIDYAQFAQWESEVLRITNSHGVDVVLDPVGLVSQSLKCAAWCARVIVVGFAGGQIEKIAANRVLLKNVSIVGLHWGAYEKFDPNTVPEVWKGLFELISERKYRGIVYQSTNTIQRKFVGLDDVGRALRVLENKEAWGKLVITIPQLGISNL
ncbi:hypothetical protein B7463_g3048, partial [Scytalidium lignicola]